MRYVVFDTGPLIKGARLERTDAEQLVTVPEVLREVRDPAARHLLATLPCEVEVREPSDEAMAAVSRFAKLTGDLPALSTVDLRVLALTWMLEKEYGGLDRLRATPAKGAPGASATSAAAAGAGASGEPRADPSAIDGADDIAALAAELDEAAALGGEEEVTRSGEAAADGGEAEGEEEEEVEEILDEVPMRISDGLYIGSLDAAMNLPALRAAGITHVLTVARELTEPPPSEFVHMHVDARDEESEDLRRHFGDTAAFIDAARKAGGAVLVHCLAGRSRSATVVCAYLMHTSAPAPLTPAAALRHVEAVRPWVGPNAGFLAQLEEYRAELSRASSDEAPPAEPPADGAAEGGDGADPSEGAADDDEVPWITPSNLRARQAADCAHGAPADDGAAVGCMTTDYAMQSVLLQMGLKLLSVEGMVLRSIKQWVLRCSGCFTEHRDAGRAFCSKCGNATLTRLAAIVRADGSTFLLPEAGAPARVRSTNTRGTKYPMPKPKAGRHAQNLVLAEDQLQEAEEKLRRQGKKKGHDVFDPDYDVDAHFGRKGRKGAPSGVNVKVGYGKRNPNDVRSRPKRT